MSRVMAGVFLSLLLSIPFVGCSDDEGYNQACAVDADCRVVTSCCDGCFAIHVTETLEPCEAECVADPCATRYGTAVDALEAYCAEGLCAARVSP